MTFTLPDVPEFTELSEQELRLALTDFLLKNYSEGRRTLIVIDEVSRS